MELFRLNEADRELFLRLAYDRAVMEMNYGRVFREEEAERVCSRWPAKAQEIYMDIMTKLL